MIKNKRYGGNNSKKDVAIIFKTIKTTHKRAELRIMATDSLKTDGMKDIWWYIIDTNSSILYTDEINFLKDYNVSATAQRNGISLQV